jgi:hypothetical protein
LDGAAGAWHVDEDMKALAFLLFLASVVLGGWAWWERSERMAAESELAAMTLEKNRFEKSAKESIGDRIALASGGAIKASGPTGILEQLKDLGIRMEDEDGKKPGSDLKEPGEKSAPPEAGDMAKLLRDPAVRQAMRARADAQLELIYGDYFKKLGLDETKRDALLAILKERQGTQTDLGLSVFDKKQSPAERKAIAEKLSRSAKEAGSKLREMLGKDYAAFEQFEKSAPEREQMAFFSSMLKEKNIALDEAGEKKILDVVFQERQAFKFDHDLSDVKALQPEALTEAAVDRYMEQNAKLQQQVQAKVKPLLSAEQYDIFLKAQENQQQTAQMQLEWLRQLAGGHGADVRD